MKPFTLNSCRSGNSRGRLFLLLLALLGLGLELLELRLLAETQIQGRPTPFMWEGINSSFDNMAKYPAGRQVNGLNKSAPAHLGAKFAGGYADRMNAFGLQTWDTMAGYSAGQALSGLDLGFGLWPGTLTAYADRQNYFPGITWDDMSTYTPGSVLAGNSGGANNNAPAFVSWQNVYIEGLIDVVFTGGGGGTITPVNPAYNVFGCDIAVYYTLDGSTPNTSSTVVYATPGCGNTLSLPDPSFLKVLPIGSFIHGNVSSFTYCSLGTCWSNQVVVNGGSAPAQASVILINNFWTGILSDWGAGPPVVYALNLIAPDSLTAAITPQIWRQIPNTSIGLGIWTNHSFVSGDLTVNGLTGNGTTKFLDTGFHATDASSAQSFAVGVYAYTAAANGFDFGAIDFGGNGLQLASKYSDNKAYSVNGANPGNIISPGSPGNGFYLGSRTSSTSHKLYFANSGSAWAQVGATDATAFSGAANSQGIYTFALNQGGAAFFSSDTLSAVIVTEGLTSSQGQALYNRLQTLRTAWGGGYR